MTLYRAILIALVLIALAHVAQNGITQAAPSLYTGDL